MVLPLVLELAILLAMQANLPAVGPADFAPLTDFDQRAYFGQAPCSLDSESIDDHEQQLTLEPGVPTQKNQTEEDLGHLLVLALAPHLVDQSLSFHAIKISHCTVHKSPSYAIVFKKTMKCGIVSKSTTQALTISLAKCSGSLSQLIAFPKGPTIVSIYFCSQ